MPKKGSKKASSKSKSKATASSKASSRQRTAVNVKQITRGAMFPGHGMPYGMGGGGSGGGASVVVQAPAAAPQMYPAMFPSQAVNNDSGLRDVLKQLADERMMDREENARRWETMMGEVAGFAGRRMDVDKPAAVDSALQTEDYEPGPMAAAGPGAAEPPPPPPPPPQEPAALPAPAPAPPALPAPPPSRASAARSNPSTALVPAQPNANNININLTMAPQLQEMLGRRPTIYNTDPGIVQEPPDGLPRFAGYTGGIPTIQGGPRRRRAQALPPGMGNLPQLAMSGSDQAIELARASERVSRGFPEIAQSGSDQALVVRQPTGQIIPAQQAGALDVINSIVDRPPARRRPRIETVDE